MAHFAQLDENNLVTQVIVVDNANILDDKGNESEAIGVSFCKALLGADTVWKQTSYNGNFRKNYAGIGFTYDAYRDAFICPKPHDSWTLDESTCQWEAPLAYPDDEATAYYWDEDAYQADNTTGWAKVIV